MSVYALPAFSVIPYSRLMKISRDWLGDYLDWIEADPATIAERITRGMGEVDEVEEQGALMENCCVGKVLTLEKHPNADKLSVCTVQTDQGVKTVVCGGTNLKKDMLIAFAHVGATVKAGGEEMLTLKKVSIRGQESEGMICAAEEVEIETMFPSTPEDGNRPIANLTAGNYKPGTPLRKALGLTDVIFHIDNHAITNRPDLFSHTGVARELVAMGLAKWKKQPKMPAVKLPKKSAPFTIHNEVKDLVPYYEACLLNVDGSCPSPEWMQRRLAATGWRPINLMVDVTNYVLMETGMPLHAFDADDFRGDLHIRKAKKGEKITTLDKATRELPEGALVISDKEGIFDLLGVMGGLRTSNKPSTRNIFLQAGIVEPVSVRKTVIAMGHRTDAATVYEKGVMPVTAATGLRRAIELLMELSPSCTAVATVQWGKQVTPKAVKTKIERLQSLLGMPIPAPKVKKILSDLGCDVKGTTASITITPPLWRRDITHEQDVAEEVARIFGYANLTPTMPNASIMPPERDHRVNMIRDGLKEERATELLHLAFTSPAQLKKIGFDLGKSVAIENPIGEEVSRMRVSLVPSLLETAGREVSRGESLMLKVFEHGHTFAPKSETDELAYVVAAKGKTTIKDEPMLVAKADLTRALQKAGYVLSFAQTSDNLPTYAHAGRSAVISCQGKTVGLLTEVQPEVRRAFDLPGRTAVATLDLGVLKKLEPFVAIATPLPAFPSVELDETIAPPKTAYAQLMQKLKKIDPLLKAIETVDLYEDATRKTMTFRFTYRADDRTLTQAEVEGIHAKVLAELKKA
jgi:phenylalanyl-tRNA synthetase beta chain